MKSLQSSLQNLRIGICGVGVMGTGLVTCFKRAGYHVLAWDQDQAKLSTLDQRVRGQESWLDQHVGSASQAGGRIEPLGSLGPLDQEADIIVECIVEELAEKANLYRQLTCAQNRDVIFLTTTSGLSITEMGRRSGCARQLAGAHFWNPSHLMPLVEIVRGLETSSEVVDQACRLAESIGKIPVKVNFDVPGFIGNRMLHALWREAIHLVEQGVASAAEIDLVSKYTFGLRMAAVGPLENIDLVGLDLVEKIHSYLLADLARNTNPSESIKKAVKEGRLGMKSGQGYYDWRSRNAAELIQLRDLHLVQELKRVEQMRLKSRRLEGEEGA